jgi:hypothetical protein
MEVIKASRYQLPVGRRAKIFTAEDAEDAERKTEGKRERLAIGRPSPDGSPCSASTRCCPFEDERGKVKLLTHPLGAFLCVLRVLCGEK